MALSWATRGSGYIDFPLVEGVTTLLYPPCFLPAPGYIDLPLMEGVTTSDFPRVPGRQTVTLTFYLWKGLRQTLPLAGAATASLH